MNDIQFFRSIISVDMYLELYQAIFFSKPKRHTVVQGPGQFQQVKKGRKGVPTEDIFKGTDIYLPLKVPS